MDDATPTDDPAGIRMGWRRARLHWMRAGYEVVAGLGAFIDEIVPRREADESDTAPEVPTKIELED